MLLWVLTVCQHCSQGPGRRSPCTALRRSRSGRLGPLRWTAAGRGEPAQQGQGRVSGPWAASRHLCQGEAAARPLLGMAECPGRRSGSRGQFPSGSLALAARMHGWCSSPADKGRHTQRSSHYSL